MGAWYGYHLLNKIINEPKEGLLGRLRHGNVPHVPPFSLYHLKSPNLQCLPPIPHALHQAKDVGLALRSCLFLLILKPAVAVLDQVRLPVYFLGKSSGGNPSRLSCHLAKQPVLVVSLAVVQVAELSGTREARDELIDVDMCYRGGGGRISQGACRGRRSRILRHFESYAGVGNGFAEDPSDALDGEGRFDGVGEGFVLRGW